MLSDWNSVYHITFLPSLVMPTYKLYNSMFVFCMNTTITKEN